jgi:hypothetical protein
MFLSPGVLQSRNRNAHDLHKAEQMSEIEADLKFSAAAYLRDLAASAKTPETQAAALT